MYLREKLGTNCTNYFTIHGLIGMYPCGNRCGDEVRSRAQNRQAGSVAWCVDRCTDHHYNTGTRGMVPVMGCGEFLPVERVAAWVCRNRMTVVTGHPVAGNRSESVRSR